MKVLNMPVYLFLSSRVRYFYFLPPVCRKIPEIESQQKGKFCDFWTCSIMIPWRDSASWIQIFIFSRSDIIIIIYLIFIFCKGYAFEIILKQKLNTSDFFFWIKFVHCCRTFLLWWKYVFWHENTQLESFWPAQIGF